MRAGDVAYQIRAGQIMLDTHSVLRTDPFTFTVVGRPWLNQQWADGVMFALLYGAGGWRLLSLVRAVLVALTFGFVLLACRSSGCTYKQAARLTIGAFLVAAGGIVGLTSLRPQLFGMLLFALTMWLLANRRRHPQWVWAIPPLEILWANLHGSFVLGPLLVGLALLEDLGERRQARRTAAVAVLSLIATAVNPFGIRVWAYVVDLSTNPVLTRTLTEWQPPSIRTPPGAVFFVSVIAVVALVARNKAPVPWPTLLSLGVFFLIALQAERGIFWWALATPPLLAPFLPAIADRPPRDQPRLANTAIAALLGLLIVALMPWWDVRTVLGTSYVRGVATPEGLLAAAPAGITVQLERTLQPRDRIFGAQKWGSWFEFRFPSDPVFVDSRFEIFPAGIWNQYRTVSLGQEGWQSVLESWDVQVVVIGRDEQADLIPRIQADPGWKLVYEDRDGLMFVKT